MSEKVTISFNAVDTSDSNNILFEGPIKVYASVDKPADLEALLTDPDFPTDENVFVFVRNVLKDTSASLTGDSNILSSRMASAYYMYDQESTTWTEVLIGGHTHAHKELLDQIGDIDFDSVAYGENKLLTLTKVDNDDGEADAAYEYKLEWKDVPTGLPDIPEDMQDSPAYLTIQNGKYVWKNEIIPQQTFVYKQVKVENDTNTISLEDVSYDSNNDEIMIYSGSDLVSGYYSYTCTENSINGVKYLVITFDTDKTVFDAGQIASILIIRQGVAGFMESLADEYMSKADVVSLLSGKTLSLANYVTKDELDEKANSVHSHLGQYAEYGHNHDNRYAMYNHVHNEYLSKSEVVAEISATLAEILGQDDPEFTVDDINQSFNNAILELKDEIYAKIDGVVTVSYLDTVIADLQNNISADAITIKGVSLTTYLNNIRADIERITGYATSIKMQSAVKVNLGDDGVLGGYKTGDVIEAGTSLESIVINLMNKTVAPEITTPTLTGELSTVSGYDYQSGEEVKYNYTFNFDKGDCGNISSVKVTIKKYDDDGNLLSSVDFTKENNTEIIGEVYGTLYDGKSIEVICTVKYTQGTSKYDNKGNNNYFIPAGELSYTLTAKGQRMAYFGGYDGEDIHTAKNVIPVAGDNLVTVNSNSAIYDVVFAVPSSKYRITGIEYLNQGCDIMDICDYDVSSVTGANDYKGVLYRIYTLNIPTGITQKMRFKVSVTESGDN